MAAAIDHLNNVRRRHISGQLPGAVGLQLGELRVCRLGNFQQHLRVGGDLSDGATVQLCEADGTVRREIVLRSDWWPGEPLWHGKVVGGKELFVQVRTVPNGYDLSYGGVRARVHVFTAREAELAALMPEKKAADTSKKLLCPMPGLVRFHRGRGGAGGQGGRDAGRGRGHEDAERAEGRPGCDGVEAQGQARRQPRGRCGDYGVRLSINARASGGTS